MTTRGGGEGGRYQGMSQRTLREGGLKQPGGGGRIVGQIVGTVSPTTVTVRDVKGNQERQKSHLQVGASGVCLSPESPTSLPETGVSLVTRNVRSVIVNQGRREGHWQTERQEFHCQQGTSGASLANRHVRSVTGKQERKECHYQTGTSGMSLANRDVRSVTGKQGRQECHSQTGTSGVSLATRDVNGGRY